MELWGGVRGPTDLLLLSVPFGSTWGLKAPLAHNPQTAAGHAYQIHDSPTATSGSTSQVSVIVVFEAILQAEVEQTP